MGKVRRTLSMLVALGAVAGALPPAASAEATCTFTPSTGALQVDATDQTRVRPDASGNLVVYDYRVVFPGRPPGFGFVPIPCSDTEAPGATGTPTATNTDSIDVRARLLAYEQVGPGLTTTGEGPAPEVEVTFSGSTLSLNGGPGNDVATFGVDAETGGIAANLNAQDESGGNFDADVAASNLTSLSYAGAPGDDTIDGGGGGGIEGPLPATVTNGFDGNQGTDVLQAGLGPSTLTAGFDGSDDHLRGGPSDDVLNPSGGDGDLIGEAGVDEIRFLGLPGVNVDLNVTTPQDTGRGTKLIQGVENVTGSLARDILIGDAGPNVLSGFSLDENDVVDGGPGDDVVKARGRVIGGEGDDRVLGSFYADRLLGGPGDDELFGSSGIDVLLGQEGADLLRARDRNPLDGKLKGDRRINCGPGSGPHERARVDEADPDPKSC
jgi:Ca2+-binding RTX toxin-like protein